MDDFSDIKREQRVLDVRQPLRTTPMTKIDLLISYWYDASDLIAKPDPTRNTSMMSSTTSKTTSLTTTSK